MSAIRPENRGTHGPDGVKEPLPDRPTPLDFDAVVRAYAGDDPRRRRWIAALLLYEMLGVSQEQLALVFDRTPGTIGRQIRQCRRELVARNNPQGADDADVREGQAGDQDERVLHGRGDDRDRGRGEPRAAA